MKKIFFLFLMFAFLNSNNPEVLAQSGSTTATVLGVVKDPENAVIAGATVTVKQLETNLTRTLETTQEGVFQIIQLPPGDYEISVSAPGYNIFKTRAVLTIGATLFSEVSLLLSTTSEVIEVKADNPFTEVKTESSNVNGKERIDNLPINRRDFLDFSLTSPRITPDRVPNQGIFSTSGLSFNGQSGRFNNITIDGLDNNDINQGAVRATFSQEAVQEFQVVSDGYSAEFGRALSGVVNIVTKGGGNQFHGSLFLLNRNDEISARDSFDRTKSPYSQYQFGATLSGPIKKDKAFFFTSFERLTIKQNIFVTIADETIKAGRNLGYPLNNGTEPFPIGSTSFLARADFRLNQSDTFWVRYNNNFGFNGAFEPFGGLADRTSSGDLNVEDNSVALNNTFISSKFNLVNETRFLYSRRDQESLPVNTDAGVQLNAPEGSVSFGHNNFVPEFNFQRIYQIVNITSLTRGKHQIKFGSDFTYIKRPPKKNGGLFPDGFATFSPIDFSALFGMPGLPFFSSLQAFDPSLRTPGQLAFLGSLGSSFPGFPSNINLANQPIPLIYLQGFGANEEIELNSKLFSSFVQDDIRLKENLILKLGLRYDVNRVDFTPKNNGNFSPRVSIAYRPTKLPRASLHASYGLFFTVPFTRSTLSARSSELGLKLLFIPLPISVIPFSMPGHKFSSQDQIPSSIPFIPQLNLATQYQPDLKNSYSQQLNVGADYLVGNNTVFSLSYNFVRGIKLFSLRDTNPVINPVPNNPLQSQIVGRIDPTKGSLLEFESAFDSYYHALSFLVNRRFSKLNFLAHYTFSKGIDNIADFSVSVTDRANDPLNLAGERGLSVQDTRNRFVFSGTWDLDYTKNPYLRGFQISSIISLNTGRPYNLLAGVDLNQNGDGGLSDRPLGLGRNVGVTPGFASVDFRLTRNITFRDNYKIQAFAEVFNLFNRLNINPNLINRTFLPDAQGNFNLPAQENGRYILTPNRFRGGFAPRQFQLGFRLTF